jgi:hypothetical protein
MLAPVLIGLSDAVAIALLMLQRQQKHQGRLNPTAVLGDESMTRMTRMKMAQAVSPVKVKQESKVQTMKRDGSY